MSADLIFYQFFEADSSTFTYLIGDGKSRECVLIDSVVETVERDIKWVEELGLELRFVLDTHIHADHITAASILRQRLSAKTAVSAASRVNCADLALQDQDTVRCGDIAITCLATPGHTDSCMSFLVEGMVFTGDSLMIRGTGRTDFQQGSAERLYQSIHQKLFTLPDDTKVYPAHDYQGQCSSTIGLEKRCNPRVGQSKSIAEFVQIMNELKLANPKKLEVAVPANMSCGDQPGSVLRKVEVMNGIPHITPSDVQEQMKMVRIIDVRRPDEFNGELGHIEGAKLVSLGPDLEAFLQTANRDQAVVFVCRSGARSGQATMQAMELKFKSVANMSGGMLRWNDEVRPTGHDT